MATLYPFTPEGVQDKLDELYALSDPALFAQADAIEADFGSWIINNFSLSVEQQSFLDNMNDEALNYFGSQCALCFRHRRPITLIYPSPPTTPGYAKLPESSNTLKVNSDDSGNIEVTGSLTFTMVYRT
ncbi:hypothetical protein NU10_02775 [Flavobacterium dauae]|uniref:hypothetical protein n=1 Tax=Flavobacterium dauae TaxID=1563479 RepID=UPI00101DF449|nr:hypothetical protein [Flavobacterium dauae]WLD24345.1 hypothetical protein NU10_02775 [Flavobacterium dauae]